MAARREEARQKLAQVLDLDNEEGFLDEGELTDQTDTDDDEEGEDEEEDEEELMEEDDMAVEEQEKEVHKSPILSLLYINDLPRLDD